MTYSGRLRRLSPQSARIVAHLLANPDSEHHGYELIQTCSVATQTAYRLLGNLLDRGWATERTHRKRL